MSKFTGENYGVAKKSTESYDGNRVVIGSISFVVEPWFKGKTLVAIDCNSFLKNEYKDPDWKDGIPTKWIKDEWRGSIEVI